MNKEWSEQNKKMQGLLKKATFDEGIQELLNLRNVLFNEILSWKEKVPAEKFAVNPFYGKKLSQSANHNASLAWSLWHVFRIEDIVVHTLINKDEQALLKNKYAKKMNATSITTGNEQSEEELLEFSKKLKVDVLYEYIQEVKSSTDEWLKSISYEDLKQRFTDEDKERIRETKTVSDLENTAWLIDYWCGKTTKGLIQMPLSRHWIMHVEAGNYIIEMIQK